MIPVVRGKMFKRIIKVNHRLALELAIQKEVISAQKQPSYEKSVALKSLGEKKLQNQRWRPTNGCNDVNTAFF